MSARNEIINGDSVIKNTESELFKIEETLKTAFNVSVCTIIAFIYFIIVVSIMLFIQPPEGLDPFFIPIIVIIIWVVVIPVLMIIIPLFRGLRKIRIFLITDKIIRVKLPNKDPFQIPNEYSFQINWSEFDKIQVEKRTISKFLYGFIPMSHVYYNLIFKKENQVISEFKFESGMDFKMRTRKKILSNLREIAPKMNKEYDGPKQ